MKHRRRAYHARTTYNTWTVLLASPIRPLPQAWRTHQLTRMYEGLHALETSPNPAPDDWWVVSDAVNLLETLVVMGEAEDQGGAIHAAVAALAVAGARAQDEGKPIRLPGAGIEAVRGALEDYAALLATLPARTMVRAHRKTEQRIQAILRGRKQPHDIILQKD